MNINQLTASKGREIRINKGLSAEGVAKELGISKSSYSDLENGKTQITLNKIESLANIFSVPLNDLIPSGNYSQVHNGDAGNYINCNHITNNFFDRQEEQIQSVINSLNDVLTQMKTRH